MENRMLTVQDQGDAWLNKVKPALILRGKWLGEAGFQPGDKVKVRVQVDQLTVEKADG